MACDADHAGEVEFRVQPSDEFDIQPPSLAVSAGHTAKMVPIVLRRVAGNGANAIELGRYSTEVAASRRRDTLQAAGFAVRAEPLGDMRTQRWIDVAATASFDADAMRERLDAAQARPLDCATLRQMAR